MHLPPYPNYPLLNGACVLLRPVFAADAEALLEISYYDGQKAKNVSEAVDMLDKIHQDYLLGTSLHWGIEAGQTGKLMGTCGYYRGLNQGAGELGCVLLPEYRGKGYMSEAITLAATFGRDHMQLNRIYAITTQGNTPALRLLERLGFDLTREDEETLEFDLRNKF